MYVQKTDTNVINIIFMSPICLWPEYDGNSLKSSINIGARTADKQAPHAHNHISQVRTSSGPSGHTNTSRYYDTNRIIKTRASTANISHRSFTRRVGCLFD